jgi:hypothetical protein
MGWPCIWRRSARTLRGIPGTDGTGGLELIATCDLPDRKGLGARASTRPGARKAPAMIEETGPTATFRCHQGRQRLQMHGVALYLEGLGRTISAHPWYGE